jgi:hypothetical protein
VGPGKLRAAASGPGLAEGLPAADDGDRLGAGRHVIAGLEDGGPANSAYLGGLGLRQAVDRVVARVQASAAWQARQSV